MAATAVRSFHVMRLHRSRWSTQPLFGFVPSLNVGIWVYVDFRLASPEWLCRVSVNVLGESASDHH